MGGIRAQSNTVEFLALLLVMLFILHQSLVLAAKGKTAGILLLERMTVERTADRITSAVRQLEFSGYGRQTIRLPVRPFLHYHLALEKGAVILGASYENISFSTDLEVGSARVLCPPGVYPNLTLTLENWGDGVEVLC